MQLLNHSITYRPLKRVCQTAYGIVLFLLLYRIAPTMLCAQVIRVDPAFCTAEDTVTITFNAADGNMGLKNATPPIYAHTGVITSKSAHGNDWRYVVGNWGTADNRVLMTALGNQLYQIKFPLRKFYNVPADEKILKMAFVFRNTSGNLVGRDANGGDIFYQVYESNSQLLGNRFLPDANYLFLQKGSTFEVHYECSKEAGIYLYKNQVLVDSARGKTYKRLLVGEQEGQFDVTIVCSDGVDSLSSAFRYIIQPQTKVEEPPVGTRPGFQISSDHSARLSLLAPGKQHVYVLGDFNDYLPDTAFLMKRNHAGDLFWLDVASLVPGKIHHFQYLVDGVIKIADPLSTVVLDPWNDSGVSSSVYPDLPIYPFGKTNGNVTVLETEPPKYVWQSGDFVKPAKDQLLIYEFLVRDFTDEQSFAAVMDRLDYFKALGVNTLQLMPVNEFEGNSSWGYNASFTMAVDKYYGPANKLKELVDRAHQKGMAVVLDVVFNHVFSQSPLAQLYWDGALNKPSVNSPFLNADAKHPFNVGYDINHESPFTKRLVKQILQYWVEEFRIDGFRFDLSKGFTQNYTGNDANAFAKYDASRIRILKDYANHLWSIDPNTIVILEHFAENAEELELANAGMLLWGNMNYAFNQATMGYSDNDLTYAFSGTRGWRDDHLIAYMESHDEERLMFKNLQYGNGNAGYSVKNLDHALKRQEMAFAFLLMIPGPKMIWQFGELGYDYSINQCVNGTINSNCRLDPKPVRWDYLHNDQRTSIYETIAKIQALKEKTQVVYDEEPVLRVSEGLVKSIQYFGNGVNVLLMGNFHIIEQVRTFQFPHTGWWYDVLTADSIYIDGSEHEFVMPPGSMHLLVDQRDLLTQVELADQSSKAWIFPNPAQQQCIINVPRECVAFVLQDGTGCEHIIKWEQIGDGQYLLQWSEELPTGIYFIRALQKSPKPVIIKLAIH